MILGLNESRRRFIVTAGIIDDPDKPNAPNSIQPPACARLP
jgi:hypothetical protein